MSEFAAWLKHVLEQIAGFVFSIFEFTLMAPFYGLMKLLDIIGIADAITDLSQKFSYIPDSFWYFANVCELKFGIGATIVAYCIRFFIRRIPGLG